MDVLNNGAWKPPSDVLKSQLRMIELYREMDNLPQAIHFANLVIAFLESEAAVVRPKLIEMPERKMQ